MGRKEGVDEVGILDLGFVVEQSGGEEKVVWGGKSGVLSQGRIVKRGDNSRWVGRG